jgi:Mg2+ and Co2+ transporter CorA
MDIYAIREQGVTRTDSPQEVDGLLWIDVQRTESDWPQRVRDLLGVAIYERHLADLRNDRHPPFYDGSDDYDLIIVRSPDPESPPEAPRTNPIAFLITARAVVSVRPPDDSLFDALCERLLRGPQRLPGNPAALLYLLLNRVGDALLALRQPMSDKLAELQKRLLDPTDPFSDWQLLMDMRSRFRWLETNLAVQREVLDAWREQTSVVLLDEGLRVRFNDLDDHLVRVERHAGVLESDVNTLVQVHFAATSERANRIMQLLAGVSAVFLPLNLLAGLFGMNFHSMPLLGQPWGFWVLLGGMTALGVALTLWFRLRRWI